MTTADLDFDALEKRANEATPGPWSADAESFGRNEDGWPEAMAIAATVGRQKIYARAGSSYPSNDQRFIAAANPETVLALIALARRTVEARLVETLTRERKDLANRAEAAERERDSIRDRIATIASEAFGPFPVQTVEEDLTAIERGIHETGKEREDWRARAEKAEAESERRRADLEDARARVAGLLRAVDDRERERDEARVELSDKMTKLDDHRSLCGELLESARLANDTSDGYRDAHAAWQRWAAVHAPEAIGDEQKREAIDRKIAELQEECDLWRDDSVQRSDEAAPSALPVLTREILYGLPPRPALDPAHRETFEWMLRHEQDAARRLRAQSGDPECPAIDDETEARIAALTAVLGEAT